MARSHTCIQHHFKAGCLGNERSLLIRNAQLHPDNFRAHCNRIIYDRWHCIAGPKYIDNIHRLRN